MLLSIVGLFDRPADGGAVRALLEGEPIAGLTDDWNAASLAQRDKRLRTAKSRLRELKLLGSEDEADPDALDAHPVVRSHFGKALQQASPDTWRAAHERLYRHYQAVPEKDLPDTLAEMQPLFHAINHGCKAGHVQEAWRRGLLPSCADGKIKRSSTTSSGPMRPTLARWRIFSIRPGPCTEPRRSKGTRPLEQSRWDTPPSPLGRSAGSPRRKHPWRRPSNLRSSRSAGDDAAIAASNRLGIAPRHRPGHRGRGGGRRGRHSCRPFRR